MLQAELLAQELERRKQEREHRKQQKALEKKAKRLFDQQVLETAIASDAWTQEEQNKFENALLKYTPFMDKFERWTSIAKDVPGKSCNQCLKRYKMIKDYLKLRSADLMD